ncbi:MAG: RNA methyltransferase [Bdellovibrionaceae bacterium]|nr:RNA methyltransferase [Pseudobdellovibrionaceae bacterium]
MRNRADMVLTDDERNSLRVILRLAHAIERDWPREGAGLDSKAEPRLEELRARIARLNSSESAALARLAKWTDHLHEGLSLRHFYALLVPFERLAQHSLRDDEFCSRPHILENDLPARENELPPLPFAVILDNIRSAFNVGSVFRTAECFGLAEIAVCGYTPDPSDEKTAKTAMGTGADVPWRRFERVEDACLQLKQEGYAIVALETVKSATPLNEFRFPPRAALLVGNERFGISPDALRFADHICRIPMRGRKNSLNVGIAFGIAAAEFDRQQG